MVGEPERKGDDREGRRRRSAGGEDGAAGDEQVRDAVHAAGAVDYAGLRGVAHPRRAHVVIAAREIRGPGAVIRVDHDSKPPQPRACDRCPDDLHGPHGTVPVELRKPPIEPGARHAQRIALAHERDAAIAVRCLVDARADGDRIEWRGADGTFVGEPGDVAEEVGNRIADDLRRGDELPYDIGMRHGKRSARDGEATSGREVAHDLHQVRPEVADRSAAAILHQRLQGIDVVRLQRALEARVVDGIHEELHVHQLLAALYVEGERQVALDLRALHMVRLVEAGLEGATGGSQDPGLESWVLDEVAPDEVVIVAEAVRAPPVRREQQSWILDATRGEDEVARGDAHALAGQRRDTQLRDRRRRLVRVDLDDVRVEVAAHGLG